MKVIYRQWLSSSTFKASQYDSPLRSNPFSCLNEADFRLNEISHKIDKDVHDSSKVSNDSCWGEEETIGHNLQVEFDAHKDHEHILPNLKHRAQVQQQLFSHLSARLYIQPLSHLLLIPAVWGHA